MWTKCSGREGKGFAPTPSPFIRGGDVEADSSTREAKRRFLGSCQCVWIPKCLRSIGTTPTVIWPDPNTALLSLDSGKLALTSGKSWFIWGIQPHFFWKRQICWVIIGNSWTFSLQVMLSIFWRCRGAGNWSGGYIWSFCPLVMECSFWSCLSLDLSV